MLEMVWQARAWLQYVVLVLLFALALWRGAAPEKWCAGLLFAMLPEEWLYLFMVSGNQTFRTVDIGHTLIDAFTFAGLFYVALHANRVYPLWLGGAQLISLMGHLSRLAMVQIDPIAYAIMSRIPSYIEIVAMSLGLAFHVHRRRKRGNYPSWRSSSALSHRTVPIR